MAVNDILEKFKSGSISNDEAQELLRGEYFQDLGHTVIDTDRQNRTGAAEVIFGAGKSPSQISDIVANMVEQNSNVLVTRLTADNHALLTGLPDNVHYDPQSQLLWWHGEPLVTSEHTIAVVSAGTSDMAVAEEAAQTAEFFGNRVERIYDVGVAGLHRLLARVPDLRRARVLVVVAGMEGALPSVVGGLVDKPVIAVPTSVGYGAAFEGVAAMLGMLTSCASGVSVVNIDNGFGAGFLANRINRL